MSRLLKSARSLWIEAQLSAPPTIRHKAISLLGDVKDLVRLSATPFVLACDVHGQSRDGPITVTFINARIAQPRLESLLSLTEPEVRRVFRVPVWRLGDAAARSSSDLVIVQGIRPVIRTLPRERALVLPEFTHHTLDVSGDWSAVEQRIHLNIRKKKLPRVRKRGYEPEISRDARDFDDFYREIYLPTTRIRHGSLSRPMPRYEAEIYFRHGFLLQMKRDGEWVSGALCQPDGDTLQWRLLGVRGADPEEMRQGAYIALYYEAIRWANEHGFRTIDFGETGPYLESGMFRYKRGWGTRLHVPGSARLQLWINVRHLTPSTGSFLKEHPFIVTDESERLHGLIPVDDPALVTAEMRQDWEKRYATPGLESLIVRALESFVEPEGRDLILPVPAAASRALA